MLKADDPLPGKAYFLAHTSLLVATDLLRNNPVGLEVTAQVLESGKSAFLEWAYVLIKHGSVRIRLQSNP